MVSRPWVFTRRVRLIVEGDRKITGRAPQRERFSAVEHFQQQMAAKLATPAVEQGGSRVLGPAIEVPSDQVLEVGNIGHERAAIWF